ncbi:uncharacterized protein LOC144880169 isoform X2 [Branchiostoma floridae x Branchiostoma japonicum]
MMKSTKTPTPILPNFEDCEWTPSVAHLFRRHFFLQTPMYFLRWLYAVFYSLYLLFVLKAPTDADMVWAVENTSLCMLIRPASNGRSDEYEITVDDCKLRATGGFQLNNMSMRYKKGEDGVKILHFTRNGEEISDMSQIFSFWFFYGTLSSHAKCHLFSNSLVRHIVDRDLKTLQESTYTSIPLHYGLLHSPISPLQSDGNVSSFLAVGVVGTRESVMKESKNMSAWEGHQSGRRWDLLGQESLLYKLFRSRRALQGVMKRHGVDQKLLEPLFNHIVVHSMDHHGAYKSSHLRFSLHPWDTGCTTYQAFNTNMFRVMLVRPNLNPLALNTLRSINKPFYQDLYRELKNIDPDVAEMATASVMY